MLELVDAGEHAALRQRLETAEGGYERLWTALWEVRERCERGENCSPGMLIALIDAVQQAELGTGGTP